MISRRAAAQAILTGAAGALGLPLQAAEQGTPKVKLKTSLGDIVVQLDPAKAPKTVENFLQYVKDKHYDGTVFHRVINGFMIQGGGFTKDMAEKPAGKPIPSEGRNGLKNLRGTIAMARTGDPHSATSQFFINHKDNSGLDYPSPDGWGYTVFGKVVRGMDIVDRIAQSPTGNHGPHQDVPREPVIIQSIQILPAKN